MRFKSWPCFLLLMLVPDIVSACNIPVFRYALEHWRPDSIELLAFSKNDISKADRKILSDWTRQSMPGDGSANVEVIVINDLAPSEKRKELESLFEGFPIQNTYVVVRGKHVRGPMVQWHGKLADLSAGSVLTSPARDKVAERLLAGDSVVWLLIKSKDDERNERVRSLLKDAFNSLSRRIKLPDGIGLPGSELHSEVPLIMRFAIVEIDPQDAQEKFFATAISNLQPGALEDGEPLVVPIFGRGRGLEVVPGSDLDSALVEDLTVFLCGACSCQVKERNPGFDLLMSVQWERELFGEDGFTPAEQLRTNPQAKKRPILLTIPPGSNRR